MKKSNTGQGQRWHAQRHAEGQSGMAGAAVREERKGSSGRVGPGGGHLMVSRLHPRGNRKPQKWPTLWEQGTIQCSLVYHHPGMTGHRLEA